MAKELENLKCRRQTPKGVRDYERLEKKPASLPNEEITHTGPEKYHPSTSLKRVQRPTESLVRQIGVRLPCTKPVGKDWER